MKRLPIVSLLFVLVFLNLGTIRKEKTALEKTQTDPITYQKKMEEIKDGPKGPASPSLKFYPQEKFLADPPMEEEKDKSDQEVGFEALPEDVKEGAGAEEVQDGEAVPEEDWWVDWDENAFKEEDPIDESAEDNK